MGNFPEAENKHFFAQNDIGNVLQKALPVHSLGKLLKCLIGSV